jgi:uridine phosphorylase
MIDKPVFTAKEYIAKLRLPSIPAPQTAILCFQNELFSHAARWRRVKRLHIFGAEMLLLKRKDNKVGVVGKFGGGAPAAAAVTDMLSAYGVEQFIIIGLAGAMQPWLNTGDIVLSANVLRGDGASNHYLPPGESVDATAQLHNKIAGHFSAKHIPFHTGTTWTTDAPFREMRTEVLRYQQEGVLAVDMEAAAVLAVAKSNNLSAAAVFVTADNISNGVWQMPQSMHAAHKSLQVVFNEIVDCV